MELKTEAYHLGILKSIVIKMDTNILAPVKEQIFSI